MLLTRRRFFQALAASALAAGVLPDGFPTKPELWEDGFHDDTAAVQWYIDQGYRLPAGNYLIARTLVSYPSGSGSDATTLIWRGI